MHSKDILKMVVAVAAAFVIACVAAGYFSNQRAAIDAKRDAEIRLIEREEETVVQAQKTERTEERSQFWQKIVPWGDNESESNTTDIK